MAPVSTASAATRQSHEAHATAGASNGHHMRREPFRTGHERNRLGDSAPARVGPFDCPAGGYWSHMLGDNSTNIMMSCRARG